MRSKASFRGHPVHSILISFPIASFIGTLIFDSIGIILKDPFYLQTGKYLTIAGIGTALFAAIPGIVDYLHTVPPNSSAKQRATKHGLINITVVILFVIALILRNNDFSFTIILILEAIGALLLVIAGWLGGTLVYRNQIGVDIRYAGAGKSKEQKVKESGKVAVAEADELKPNQMKLLYLTDKRVVLSKTENGYVAFDDRCTHRGGSLAGGAMICGTVQCPWHGSQFDTRTGEVKAGPAKKGINTYSVVEEDGKVFLIMPQTPYFQD